jgi:hypothetical protein
LRSVRHFCFPKSELGPSAVEIDINDLNNVLVTDYERKFVLGVATSQDLEVRLFLFIQGNLRTFDSISPHYSHSFRGVAFNVCV